MVNVVKPILSARHRWLPLTVLVFTIAWWMETDADLGYATLSQIVVGGVAVALISVWYLGFGGSTLSFRICLLGSVWCVLLLLLAVFAPIYNGDIGIIGWRLRFTAAHDELLAQATHSNAATDLQASSRDYPKFLGNGYWPEVAGVELNRNWTIHPPELVWRCEMGVAGPRSLSSATMRLRKNNEAIKSWFLAIA